VIKAPPHSGFGIVRSSHLVAIAGVACLFAITLPDGRDGPTLRWWWQRDAVIVFGGLLALLALAMLLLGSFLRDGRGPAIVGASFAIASAAAAALAAPLDSGATLLVVSSFALIGSAALVAGGEPQRLHPAVRWWALGAGAATIILSVVAVFDDGGVRGSTLVACFAGAAGVACVASMATMSTMSNMSNMPAAASAVQFASQGAHGHASRRARMLSQMAIAAGMAAALTLILTPLVNGRRPEAAAAARIVMLLVTAVAAMAVLLTDARNPVSPTHRFVRAPGDPA